MCGFTLYKYGRFNSPKTDGHICATNWLVAVYKLGRAVDTPPIAVLYKFWIKKEDQYMCGQCTSIIK